MNKAMRSTDRMSTLTAYFWSIYDGWELRHQFKDVTTYAMFVGYPRSGHSLMGALLNAHPRMLISHELDVLKFLQRGATRKQIYSLIWRRNEEFVRAGYKWAGYDYEVPGQWQNRCEVLRVIGDKKGGASALRILERPELIAKLRETVEVPIRIIHITRNPFDNIVTISTREKRSLADSTQKFRRHCMGVVKTIERTTADELITMKYEDFVAAPAQGLVTLCNFLGQPAPESFIEACAARVFSSPSRTRDKLPWTPAERQEVDRIITEFSFLNGYE